MSDNDDGISDALARARARARSERASGGDPRAPMWSRRRRHADDGDSANLRHARRADPLGAADAARATWRLFEPLGLLSDVVRATLTRDWQAAVTECYRQGLADRVRRLEWPPLPEQPGDAPEVVDVEVVA